MAEPPVELFQTTHDQVLTWHEFERQGHNWSQGLPLKVYPLATVVCTTSPEPFNLQHHHTSLAFLHVRDKPVASLLSFFFFAFIYQSLCIAQQLIIDELDAEVPFSQDLAP